MQSATPVAQNPARPRPYTAQVHPTSRSRDSRAGSQLGGGILPEWRRVKVHAIRNRNSQRVQRQKISQTYRTIPPFETPTTAAPRAYSVKSYWPVLKLTKTTTTKKMTLKPEAGAVSGTAPGSGAPNALGSNKGGLPGSR